MSKINSIPGVVNFDSIEAFNQNSQAAATAKGDNELRASGGQEVGKETSPTILAECHGINRDTMRQATLLVSTPQQSKTVDFNPIANARAFGGVRTVQQRLVDLGFVPHNQHKKFVDGLWGPITAGKVAEFQKSRNLPANGVLNAATGRALFNVELGSLRWFRKLQHE